MCKYISMETWFMREDRWKPGKTCFDMQDIHTPPEGYTQGRADWIRELLTFQSLYPQEWNTIWKEYCSQHENNILVKELDYYMTDEGEIRKQEEKDTYLVIGFLDTLPLEKMSAMGEIILKEKIWDFDKFEKYCSLNETDRKTFLEEKVTPQIVQLCDTSKDGVAVKCVSDLSCAQFERKELFIDGLNSLYVIL